MMSEALVTILSDFFLVRRSKRPYQTVMMNKVTGLSLSQMSTRMDLLKLVNEVQSLLCQFDDLSGVNFQFQSVADVRAKKLKLISKAIMERETYFCQHLPVEKVLEQ